ncbi:MAG: hypothetical protein RXR18_06560 [Nitrososphaeria archaeon]
MVWVKVGVIIPSSNTTVKREFNRVFDELNITVHSARIIFQIIKGCVYVSLSDELCKSFKDVFFKFFPQSAVDEKAIS